MRGGTALHNGPAFADALVRKHIPKHQAGDP